MSREAFEALINEMWKGRLGDRDYSKQRSGNTYDAYGGNSWLNTGWLIWQAATEAAQKEWTPYKKGDDVAYDTNALVTYEFLPLGCNEYGVTEAWFRSEGWETIDDEIIDNVTAYRPLPAPFGGE